ncbi:MAG: hypothetical protein AAF485_22300 [Chloroflexota bacterium]
MSNYTYPWWLIIHRPKGLTTTITETMDAAPSSDTAATDYVITIRGEPLINAMGWLVWGPIAALITIAVVTALAIAFEIREQSWVIRGGFICLFLALPATVWAVTTRVLTSRAKTYLQSEREAETQEAIIRLNQTDARLTYQGANQTSPQTIAYTDIERVETPHPIGKQGVTQCLLTLETAQGSVILLDEMLGSQAQKMDLAQRLEKAIGLPITKREATPTEEEEHW